MGRGDLGLPKGKLGLGGGGGLGSEDEVGFEVATAFVESQRQGWTED